MYVFLLLLCWHLLLQSAKKKEARWAKNLSAHGCNERLLWRSETANEEIMRPWMSRREAIWVCRLRRINKLLSCTQTVLINESYLNHEEPVSSGIPVYVEKLCEKCRIAEWKTHPMESLTIRNMYSLLHIGLKTASTFHSLLIFYFAEKEKKTEVIM